MKRPWSPYTKRHTTGVQFRGFPQAEYRIYHDKAKRLLQIHAVHLVEFGDYETKRFLMPDEVWSRLRTKIDTVEWCVKSDLTCYRISGDHCESYGQTIVIRDHRRTSTEEDRAWAVPMARCKKITLGEDDEPKAQVLRL